MSAVRALAEATAAGVRLRAKPDGGVRVLERPEDVPPALLADLRAHKAEIAALLRGDFCCRCGDPMGWPGPAGVVLASGKALHHACYEAGEADRLRPAAGDACVLETLAPVVEPMIRETTVR